MLRWSNWLRGERVLKSQKESPANRASTNNFRFPGGAGESFVRLSKERLQGYMPWPADPFYRPIVALFIGNKLASVTPTWRHMLDTGAGKPVWVCAFETALPQKVDNTTSKLLLCLETGSVLFHEPPSSREWESKCRFDQLAVEELSQRSPWDASGFLAFLALSAFDQLDLLYRDFLGRGIDEPDFKTYLQALESGRSTILDIRDDLLLSEEFRSRRISSYDQLGKWIVWGGLKHTCASYVPGGSRAASRSSLEIVRHDAPVSSVLASISLGQEADPKAKRLWIERHKEMISQVLKSLEASRNGAGAEQSRGNFRLNGILAQMCSGKAGIREVFGEDKGRIASMPGKEGVVAFGPYLGLPPGDYCAVFQFRTDIANNQSFVKFGIEVVYGPVLLAHRGLFAAGSRTFSFSVPFSVPDDEVSSLSESRFEFRLFCEGDGRLVLMDAAVERVAPIQEGSRYHVDWLPIMSVAARALRHDDCSVSADSRVSGHFLYGPYRSLLPGRYRLICECEVSLPETAMNGMSVEIGEAKGQVIVNKDFKVQNGTNSLETVFEVKPSEADDFPQPLEFRIGKDRPVEVKVTRLLTIPISQAEPLKII